MFRCRISWVKTSLTWQTTNHQLFNFQPPSHLVDQRKQHPVKWSHTFGFWKRFDNCTDYVVVVVQHVSPRVVRYCMISCWYGTNRALRQLQQATGSLQAQATAAASKHTHTHTWIFQVPASIGPWHNLRPPRWKLGISDMQNPGIRFTEVAGARQATSEERVFWPRLSKTQRS